MDKNFAALKTIDPNSILYEDDLAKLLGKKSRRTIKRAVAAGELPCPENLRGKKYWTGQYILNFINKRLDQRETIQKRHSGK